MSNLIGIDIGGTFTDCVVVGDGGRVFCGKAPTTPSDYTDGMFDALASAARRAGADADDLWASADRFVHGTTIGTNAVVERTGARCGLLTTMGHEDVLHIARTRSIVAGLPESLITYQQLHYKPAPFVPKRLTRGVTERVDSAGHEVVALDHEQARAAVLELVADGVEAIAVGFLWSFLNPEHERAVRDIIAEVAPETFVTLSSDVSRTFGEYERITAGVINSYIGPKTAKYLTNLELRLDEQRFRGSAGLMQSSGGYVPVDEARAKPLLTLDSGPVAGVIGSKVLAAALGIENVIATDMGGTTFDAGILLGGEPVMQEVATAGQFEYHISRVTVASIGSGGGSIAKVDPVTHALRVGPESAGAVPGPACYGNGGEEATITDADVLLGMVDADAFLGGESRLDRAAAQTALEQLGWQVGMSAIDCAAGIQRIVDHQMAGLLRRVTVEAGLDPRDFWVFAYGGAGPVHAASYARELGAKGVVIPQGDFASVWSAWGSVGSDVVRIEERPLFDASPFSAAGMNVALTELEEEVRRQLTTAGCADADIVLERSIKMKWSSQVHVVEVPLPGAELDDPAMERLVNTFAERYELLFGRDTAYRAAGAQCTSVTVRGRGLTPAPELPADAELVPEPLAEGWRRSRQVHWWELGHALETPVFNGDLLRPGNTFAGPIVLESPDTSVVVRPGQQVVVDRLGNIVITLEDLSEKAPA